MEVPLFVVAVEMIVQLLVEISTGWLVLSGILARWFATCAQNKEGGFTQGEKVR